METQEVEEALNSFLKVLILPMRNGNSAQQVENYLKEHVLILPMRNGNYGKSIINTSKQPFLSYL